MADEQKPKAPKKTKAPKAQEPKETQDDLLTSAAKAIGTAAGKVASLAGAVVAEPKKSMKPAKLKKKNNPHVPRKLKKAQKKAALAKTRA